MTPAASTITINRAPVLTLWAAVVAKRLGFTWPEALSLGNALARLNAQAKGRRLGIFKPHEEQATEARRKPHAGEFRIELCGRPVPATNTPEGIRAVKGTQVVSPESCAAYLERTFGGALEPARDAMESLARAPGNPRRFPRSPEWTKARQGFVHGQSGRLGYLAPGRYPVFVEVPAWHRTSP